MLSKKKFISLVSTVALCFSLISSTASAGTYSHSNAVTYSDTYATSFNSSYKSYSSDCANFVSQCLKAGGWTHVDAYNNKTSNSSWWYNSIDWWPDENSNTWSVANDLLLFTGAYSSPLRGTCASTWSYSGTTTVATPSNMSPGDIFFYDWDGSNGVDHVSIYAANGKDTTGGGSNSSNQTGALINAHTGTRYHAIWNLNYYNTNRATTTIYAMKINNSF